MFATGVFSPPPLRRAWLIGGLFLLLLSPTLAADIGVAPSVESVPKALHPILEPLREGNREQALSAARKLTEEWSGDPDFQYLYGLAALEAEAYSEAVLALEAALIARPDDHRARLELGRAHYQTGNWRGAERAFKRVMDTSPPETVRRNIQRFLDRIATRKQQTEPRFRLTARYDLGHDTNINAATDADSIQLELFDQPLDLALRDDNRQTHDAFQAFGIDALYRQPLSQRNGFSVQADVDRTTHFSQDDFDLTHLRFGSSWFQQLGESRRMQVTATTRQTHLGRDQLRWRGGLNLELQQLLTPEERAGIALAVSTQRYPDQHQRDTDEFRLALSSRHKSASWKGRLSLSGGVEKARDSNNKHFGRRFAGVRIGAGWPVAQHHELGAQGAYRFSRYERQHPLFGKRRRDHESILSTRWHWSLTRRLTLQTHITHQRSDSNTAFYEFDRTLGEVGIRYRFIKE
ncbi:tetratricopeptide repeat protein [Halomonadaceae bacterium KBTZ08]